MVDHIHTPNDGRGSRDVFVNGNRIDNVSWADVRAGVVWFAPEPIRATRREDVYCRRLRGHVEVVFHE
ncbi:hypothetical protein ACT048_04685 [Ectopseudomonas khazarica]|uniref:hypothetical protein n=1 Tax=Ectopseudomonas khazarica TaxID=2502979 RepID=UPI0009B8048A